MKFNFPNIGEAFSNACESAGACLSDSWTISKNAYALCPRGCFEGFCPELLPADQRAHWTPKSSMALRYIFGFVIGVIRAPFKVGRLFTRGIGISKVGYATWRYLPTKAFVYLFNPGDTTPEGTFDRTYNTDAEERIYAENLSFERFKRSPFSWLFDHIGMIPAFIGSLFVIAAMLLVKGFRLITRCLGLTDPGIAAAQFVGYSLYNKLFGKKENVEGFYQEITKHFPKERFYRSPVSMICDGIGVVIAVVAASLVVGIPMLLLKSFRLATRAIGVSYVALNAAMYSTRRFYNFLFAKKVETEELKTEIKKELNKERLKRSPVSMSADIIGGITLTTVFAGLFGVPFLLVKGIRLMSRALGVSYPGYKLATLMGGGLYRKLFDKEFNVPVQEIVTEIKNRFTWDRFKRSPMSMIFDGIGLMSAALFTSAFICLPMIAFKIFRLATRMLGIWETGYYSIQIVFSKLYNFIFAPEDRKMDTTTQVEDLREILKSERSKRSPLSFICDVIGTLVSSAVTGIIVGTGMAIVKAFRLLTRALGISEPGYYASRFLVNSMINRMFGDNRITENDKVRVINRFTKERLKRSPLSTIFDFIGVITVIIASAIFVGIPMSLFKLFRLATRAIGISDPGLAALKFSFQSFYNIFFSSAKRGKYDTQPHKEVFNQRLFDPARRSRSPLSWFFDVIGTGFVFVLSGCVIGLPFALAKSFRGVSRALGISEAGLNSAKYAMITFKNKLFGGAEDTSIFAKNIKERFSEERWKNSRFSYICDKIGIGFAFFFSTIFTVIPMIVFKGFRLATRAIGISEPGGAALSIVYSTLINKLFGYDEKIQAEKDKLHTRILSQARIGRSPLSWFFDFIGTGVMFLVSGVVLTVGLGLFKVGRLLTRALGISNVGFNLNQLILYKAYNKLFCKPEEAVNTDEYLKAIKDGFTKERFKRSPLSTIFDAIGLISVTALTGIVFCLPMALFKTFRLLTRAIGFSDPGLAALCMTPYVLYNKLFADVDKKIDLQSYKKDIIDRLLDKERMKRSPLSWFFDGIGTVFLVTVVGAVCGLPMAAFKILRLTTRALGISKVGFASASITFYHLYKRLFKLNEDKIESNKQIIKDRFTKERFKRSPLSVIFDGIGLVMAAVFTTVFVGLPMVLFKMLRLLSRGLGLSRPGLVAGKFAVFAIANRLFDLKNDTEGLKEVIRNRISKERFRHSPLSTIFDAIGVGVAFTAATLFVGIPMLLFKGIRLFTRALGISIAGKSAFSIPTLFAYNLIFCEKENIRDHFRIIQASLSKERFMRSPLSTIFDAIGVAVGFIASAFVMTFVTAGSFLFGVHKASLMILMNNVKYVCNLFLSRTNRYDRQAEKSFISQLSTARWLVSGFNLLNVAFLSGCGLVYGGLVAVSAALRITYRFITGFFSTIFRGCCLKTSYHADYSLRRDGNPDTSEYLQNDIVILRNNLNLDGEVTTGKEIEDHSKRSIFGRIGQMIKFEIGKSLRLMSNSLHEDILDFLEEELDKKKDQYNKHGFFRNDDRGFTFDSIIEKFKRTCKDEHDQSKIDEAAVNIRSALTGEAKMKNAPAQEEKARAASPTREVSYGMGEDSFVSNAVPAFS